jgi:hypothetical protein
LRIFLTVCSSSPSMSVGGGGGLVDDLEWGLAGQLTA